LELELYLKLDNDKIAIAFFINVIAIFFYGFLKFALVII